jgi:glycosyltransferase involved in cell wall biosynthesis
MPANPLVSVAFCTYNGSRFLSQQLESILAQSYKEIEIIAVDDCSTDNTWDILQNYAQKDSRIKTHRNEHNLGHTLNFEKAISLCTGDYIALSDQDDIWNENKIECLMESAADFVMVYHDSDFIDENSHRLDKDPMSRRHRMYEGKSCMPVILANNIHGHAILFDSKLKAYLSPFNESFSHDWAIVFTAFNIGSVKFVNKVLVHYRQHQNSITDILEQKKDVISQKHQGLERLGVKVGWLRYCLEFEHKKEPELVDTACRLFLDLSSGKNKLKCFFFMLKHFDLLFYTINHKHRGFLSKINFVRKLCYV